jgi:hypothetical protein
MRRTTGLAMAAVMAAGALAAPAALARGGGDDRGGRDGRADVRRAGACTAASTAKLSLHAEDRGLEIEFEVDQNRVGVPWDVVVAVNGRTVVRRTVRTTAPSGSFEVHRVTGAGRVSATATRASGGEVCRASAAL